VKKHGVMYNQIHYNNLIVNCFKKSSFYFNEEQCDEDCLENNDGDDGEHDWQMVANKLNINQQTTFQSNAIIDYNVVVSRL